MGRCVHVGSVLTRGFALTWTIAFTFGAFTFGAFTSGCTWRGADQPYWPSPAESAAFETIRNPLFAPICDREFLWNQLVDTIDDYFKIQRENRVRVIGDELIEGRIETFPTVGATMLEPWRRDSTPGFERLHSTLQSVRRRAVVGVSPTEGGFLVEVAVFKDLEDLERPGHSTVNAATLPHDDSPDRNEPSTVESAVRPSWIPQGRDVSLEQQVLRELQSRLAGGTP